MRMALVEIIGMLIREIATSEEGEQEQEAREKKISGLFELLTERFLDMSSYVRAKVINTLSRLCECVQVHAFDFQFLIKKFQTSGKIPGTTPRNHGIDDRCFRR